MFHTHGINSPCLVQFEHISGRKTILIFFVDWTCFHNVWIVENWIFGCTSLTNRKLLKYWIEGRRNNDPRKYDLLWIIYLTRSIPGEIDQFDGSWVDLRSWDVETSSYTNCGLKFMRGLNLLVSRKILIFCSIYILFFFDQSPSFLVHREPYMLHRHMWLQRHLQYES